MLQAIDRKFAFTQNASASTFSEDAMMHYACLKQLEIIGEASNHLSPGLKSNHPLLEWRKITAFRNFSIHQYFDVNIEIVWSIINDDLPELRTGLQQILDSLPDENP
ncbi:MAG: hypothetical protein AVDCRST_MAG56-6467 [uncultured Cytophagales bacterium]|uniref:DUF86 domain-containing protein n=1 Tax=uncultured Cytophagales bacterium TaxID=158755 RepID=A0A6J4KHT7_9SPHI|nr:MAG: hypothetical protein AVDCRST_MAG56-6467 [uncultured Cytophagales bacterium]